MSYVLLKYLITAAVVVAVSEFARLNDRLGGLVAALPLVTVLTLIWLNYESQSTIKISNHAYYTFWYVIPTLPFFLIFPYLLSKLGFWFSLLISVCLTIFIFYIYLHILKAFGINLNTI
jgi:hypothetical protein